MPGAIPEISSLIASNDGPITCNAAIRTVTETAVGCNGTAVDYLWSNGQTGASFNTSFDNTYMVTVTQVDNGCTASAYTDLTENFSTPQLAISSSNNVSCFGGVNGSATVTVTSGVGPYSYSWSPAGGTSSTASSLTAGAYLVTVTGENGCSSTSSVLVTQPSVLSASAAIGNIACFGGSTSVVVFASGGTSAYAGVGTFTRSAGSYSFTVTDANGCTATVATLIPQPSELSVSTSVVNPTCFGAANGTASASVSGGTSGYTYFWSTTPAQFTASATNLSDGSYVVTVTDANGCSKNSSATIVQPQQPQQPTLLCYQTAVFNSSTCQWVISGTPNPVISTTTSACSSFTWPVNSVSYTASGTYSYTSNCQDYQLNLTIKQPTSGSSTVSACRSYTWQGTTY
ncbi:MAG: SprB repeat-containing protein, partial [Bacteroidota bacterium]